MYIGLSTRRSTHRQRPLDTQAKASRRTGKGLSTAKASRHTGPWTQAYLQGLSTHRQRPLDTQAHGHRPIYKASLHTGKGLSKHRQRPLYALAKVSLHTGKGLSTHRQRPLDTQAHGHRPIYKSRSSRPNHLRSQIHAQILVPRRPRCTTSEGPWFNPDLVGKWSPSPAKALPVHTQAQPKPAKAIPFLPQAQTNTILLHHPTPETFLQFSLFPFSSFPQHIHLCEK